jgi:hypothetical protein
VSNPGLRNIVGLKGARKQWSNPCHGACHCWCGMTLICHCWCGMTLICHCWCGMTLICHCWCGMALACHCWCGMALICHWYQAGTSPPLSWDLTPDEWAEWGIGYKCWNAWKLTESMGDNFKGACEDYSMVSPKPHWHSKCEHGRQDGNNQRKSKPRTGSSKSLHVQGCYRGYGAWPG